MDFLKQLFKVLLVVVVLTVITFGIYWIVKALKK